MNTLSVFKCIKCNCVVNANNNNYKYKKKKGSPLICCHCEFNSAVGYLKLKGSDFVISKHNFIDREWMEKNNTVIDLYDGEFKLDVKGQIYLDTSPVEPWQVVAYPDDYKTNIGYQDQIFRCREEKKCN